MANTWEADTITWRWSLNGIEIDGEENYEALLTEFSRTTKRGPGRPSAISDDELRHAFRELKFLLEESWACIGWNLKRVKEPEDIAPIFNRVSAYTSPRLEPFREAMMRKSTAKELRQVCARLAAAKDELREAQAEVTRTKEKVELASSAVRNESSRKELAAIQRIGAQAGCEFESANAAFQTNQANFQSLQAELAAREAYFAQSQLVAFIRSGRREATPLNLAMAMAGLPRISARISCERCSALIPEARHSQAYLMFKAVEGVFREPPPNIERAYESMRAHLTRSSKRDQYNTAGLRTNWYFLKAAIESIYPAHRHPRGSIPYLIFAEYMRLLKTCGAADRLLAQEDQI